MFQKNRRTSFLPLVVPSRRLPGTSNPSEVSPRRSAATGSPHSPRISSSARSRKPGRTSRSYRCAARRSSWAKIFSAARRRAGLGSVIRRGPYGSPPDSGPHRSGSCRTTARPHRPARRPWSVPGWRASAPSRRCERSGGQRHSIEFWSKWSSSPGAGRRAGRGACCSDAGPSAAVPHASSSIPACCRAVPATGAGFRRKIQLPTGAQAVPARCLRRCAATWARFAHSGEQKRRRPLREVSTKTVAQPGRPQEPIRCGSSHRTWPTPMIV